MNPSSAWRRLSQMAFLETDPQQKAQKIRAARQAIAAREGADDMTAIEADDIIRAIEVLNRREMEQN